VDRNFTNPTGMGRLSARWTVPKAPTQKDDQTIDFFPGLQGTAQSQHYIIQHVPAWGDIPGGGGGPYWTIASWQVGKRVFRSTTVRVEPGDVIYGEMLGSDCALNVCAKWSITKTDETSGKATRLVSAGNPYGSSSSQPRCSKRTDRSIPDRRMIRSTTSSSRAQTIRAAEAPDLEPVFEHRHWGGCAGQSVIHGSNAIRRSTLIFQRSCLGAPRAQTTGCHSRQAGTFAS